MYKDLITIIKANGERIIDIKSSVQSTGVYINDTRLNIDEGDLIERKINETKIERYVITNVHYTIDRTLGHISLKVEKQTEHKKDVPVKNEVNIQNLYNSGNFTLENHGTLSVENINNEIDAIISFLDTKMIKDKEEILKLLNEAKNTKNESDKKNILVDAMSVLGNTASIGSLLISILGLLK